MLESPTTREPSEFERIAVQGPTGALALCAVAVTLVAAVWVCFYLFAFLPRGPLQ